MNTAEPLEILSPISTSFYFFPSFNLHLNSPPTPHFLSFAATPKLLVSSFLGRADRTAGLALVAAPPLSPPQSRSVARLRVTILQSPRVATNWTSNLTPDRIQDRRIDFASAGAFLLSPSPRDPAVPCPRRPWIVCATLSLAGYTSPPPIPN